MKHPIKHLLTRLSRTLLPDYCSFCQTAVPDEGPASICPDCFDKLPWATARGQTVQELSAFYYQAPIDQYILSGKGNQRLDRLSLLGELIRHNFSQRLTTLPEAILPVPLHPKRLRQRGFNQSIELIRPLAKSLHIPLLIQHAHRTRHTVDQKQLSAQQRQANVQQAFTLQHPLPYQHIALFDDVITTGATCLALQSLLQQHGIKTVEIWCCATTKHDPDE